MLSALPERPGEDHQQGIEFQPPRNHAQTEYPLGRVRKLCVGIHRPDAAEAGTDVEDAGDDRTERREDVHPQRGQQQPREDDHQPGQIHQVEQAVHGRLGRGLAAQADREHPLRFGHAAELPIDDPAEEQDPRHLDPARGGAGTAAHEHEHEQGELAQRIPGGIVIGHEAGGREDRGHLEQRGAERLFPAHVVLPEQHRRDDGGRTEQQQQVAAQFIVSSTDCAAGVLSRAGNAE